MHSASNNNKNSITPTSTPVIPLSTVATTTELKDLQPRPETLAVLSRDMFAEKCAQRSSPKKSSKAPSKQDLNKAESIESIQVDKKLMDEKVTQPPVQIPFIEDEFDEVSYILHRRQFGNKEINKEPISEETILIKKVGFFQKLATPLKYNLTDQQNRLTKPLNSSSTTELMQSDQTLETSAKNENDPLILNNKEDDKQLLEIVELDKKPTTDLNDFNQQPTNTNHTTANLTHLTNPPQTFRTADKTTLVTSTAPKPLANNKTKSKSKYENRARKSLRTITFILGAFVFCWAPFHMVGIFDLFKNDICSWCNFTNSTFYRHFYNTTYFLCYLNSPINPFCYALANQQFKKTFSRILKGDWRRT